MLLDEQRKQINKRDIEKELDIEKQLNKAFEGIEESKIREIKPAKILSEYKRTFNIDSNNLIFTLKGDIFNLDVNKLDEIINKIYIDKGYFIVNKNGIVNVKNKRSKDVSNDERIYKFINQQLINTRKEKNLENNKKSNVKDDLHLKSNNNIINELTNLMIKISGSKNRDELNDFVKMASRLFLGTFEKRTYLRTKKHVPTNEAYCFSDGTIIDGKNNRINAANIKDSNFIKIGNGRFDLGASSPSFKGENDRDLKFQIIKTTFERLKKFIENNELRKY